MTPVEAPTVDEAHMWEDQYGPPGCDDWLAEVRAERNEMLPKMADTETQTDLHMLGWVF